MDIFILLVCFTAFISGISTSQPKQTIHQYLHVTGVGPHAPGIPSLPNVGLPTQLAIVPGAVPTYTSLGIPNIITKVPTNTPVTTSLQPTPPKPCPSQKPPSTNVPNGVLDSEVLNNLAIALQLLIMTNILNMPFPENVIEPPLSALESLPKPVQPLAVAYSQNQQPTYYQLPAKSYYSYETVRNTSPNTGANVSPSAMPNANFVGSSYVDSGSVLETYSPAMGVPAPSSRPNSMLKSPYEALASSPSYSEYSQYSSFGNSRDFQSPYSSILGTDSNHDLFSMDFF